MLGFKRGASNVLLRGGGTVTTEEERKQRKAQRRASTPLDDIPTVAAKFAKLTAILVASIWSVRYLRISSTSTVGPYLRDACVVVAVCVSLFVATWIHRKL